ncbi:MAG: glycine cleavage system protein GcvH [Thermoprotei archaeon]|nr:MAG: glycine cleavage system protein GcvH [Thermoprotei archaeon]RLF22213.1 MAG: glycine cleavage system protein GcvH [Thermoprotei archaeon]
MKVDDYEVPEDLLYTDGHLWIRREGDLLRLGITDYAQKQIREVLFVDLPEKGAVIERGLNIATLETIKRVVDLSSPVKCEVVEVNEELQDRPDLVNSDPYGKGWIVLVKPLEDLEGVLAAEEYASLIKEGSA